MAEASTSNSRTQHVDDEVSFRYNAENHESVDHESVQEDADLSHNNNNDPLGSSLETGDRLRDTGGFPIEFQAQLSDLIKNVVRDELQRSRVPEARDVFGNRSPIGGGRGARARSSGSTSRVGEYNHSSENLSRFHISDNVGFGGRFHPSRPHSVASHSHSSQSHDFHSRSRSNHDFNPRFNREDLSIKVRGYDPKDVDWHTYISHFEAVANQAGWTLRTKCARLMGALPSSLTGVVSGLPEPLKYTDLVARLDAVHGASSSRDDAIMKLSSCHKANDETIPLFAERVRQLIQRAYPEFTQIDKEEQALRVFLQGLPARHDMRLHMRMQNFHTLRDAAAYGTRLEQVIRDEKYHEQKKPVYARSSKEEAGQQTVGEYQVAISRLCSDVAQVKSNQEKQFQSMKSMQDTWKRDGNTKEKGKKASPQESQREKKTVGKQRTKENSPFCVP